MIIADTSLFMTAESRLEKTDRRTDTLSVWVDPPKPSADYTVTLSPQALDAPPAGSEDLVENDPKLLLIKRLIEVMTGKTIRTLTAEDLEPPSQENSDIPGREPDSPSEGPERVGWGLRYEYEESHTETESSTFRAGGIVRTADGKEIQFALDVQMDRSFTSSIAASLRAGDALIDPLVINFNGPAVLLADQTFSFDLNADGKDETIPFVGGGSGLLAFDKNGDNKINDGRELFGPGTGNGFAELAKFDGDKNGWIDEKDDAYESLSIWTKDADGTDVLTGLRESLVGAIFTGYADTAFALKDEANQLQGQVRRTGLYLTGSGKPGSVQQIDIAV